ncbi:hypothetical protein [Falsiroseomonas sp. HW251]|uniref:hypothetical protein n=1 Tax=Falsiroseomonas sp. HW251 TaxID=3390998 RepID=UPI003D30F377
MTITAVALIGALGGGMAASPADARPMPLNAGEHARVQPVGYYDRDDGARFYGHREGRYDWGDRRREYERARIAEAARREAMRIERERAARHAWLHAQRPYRGW